MKLSDFKLPRMFWVMLMAALLLCVVSMLAMQQLPVVIYKLALVMAAGAAGYAVDRAAFPYARPHVFKPKGKGPGPHLDQGCLTDAYGPYLVAMIRRAIIIAAAMMAVGLGL